MDILETKTDIGLIRETNEDKAIALMHPKNKNIKFTVFNALAKYIDQQVDVSALEILHLPTLSNYDGIIIQGNRAWPLKDRQFIANKAKALNIPVVSINYPLSYAYEIGTDNASSIYTLMDYLTNEKKCAKYCIYWWTEKQ